MINRSHILLFLISLFSVTLNSPGQKLSSSLSNEDKLKLLEEIISLEEKSKQKLDSGLGKVHRTFKKGIANPKEALSLFFICVEKVRYKDENKKGRDFSAWKRKFKDKHDLNLYGKVLQHQLNWLLLTLKATANPEKLNELGEEAVKNIDTLIDDADELYSYKSILEKSVIDTDFAKAYNLQGLEVKGWPLNPLKIAKIYDSVVLKEPRKKQDFKLMRSAWDKRIKQEARLRKAWDLGKEKADDKGKLEYDAWLEEDYLTLLWNKEKDCFTNGDEAQGAKNMIAHLNQYFHHKYARKWVEELKGLLKTEEK